MTQNKQAPDPPAGHRGVACGICGDPEPHHVHNEGKRIEDYFTVGRGQSEFDAARSWKAKAKAAASLAAQAATREAELREALELAAHWFENFKARPDHEGIDVSGADTVLTRARAALANPQENPDAR